MPTEPLVLVRDGAPRAEVVVPRGAAPAVYRAAAEIADATSLVTGVRLPVVEAGTEGSPTSIEPSVDTALARDEVRVQTSSSRLQVSGGSPAAVLDAATLLSERLGVRHLGSGCSVADRRSTLVLPETDLRTTPAFSYRDVFSHPAFDGNWAARNRLNGWVSEPGADRGHGAGWAWPPFHTFAWLLPAGQHFPDDPELFTLVDGERKASQFCLSSRRTLELVTERVLAWMARTPDQRFYSLTQNDNNDLCQCAECTRRIEDQGSPQGALLPFVNAIADRVATQFPDKQLVTFAYAHTLMAPRSIAPSPNVWVQVCALTDPVSLEKSLTGWSALTDRLLLWEYYTGFTHYLVPNPMLHRIGPDLRWYRDWGVKGVFAQAAYQSPGADLAELRAYVLAQQLWDPDQPVEPLIDAFLSGWFGPAAPYVAEYLELAQAPVRRLSYGAGADAWAAAQLAADEDTSLADVVSTWWTAPLPTAWLTPARLRTYDALLAEAERVTADDDVVLSRVRKARLPVQAVAGEVARRGDDDHRPRVQQWVDVARREGVTRWGEWTWVDEYAGDALGWASRADAAPPEVDLERFAADGYLALPGLLTADAVKALAVEAARVCRGERDCLGAGLAPLPPDTRDAEALATLPVLNLPHVLGPAFWDALSSPALLALAGALLGAPARPWSSRLLNLVRGMPGEVPHREGPGALRMSTATGRFEAAERTVALWLPLVASSADPLRVVPGSHRTDAAPAIEGAVDVAVEVGDAVALDSATVWATTASAAVDPAPALLLFYAPEAR